MESKGTAFRRLLETEPYVFTGGVYSPLDAQIAERVGVKAIYLSGYSVAMANGWPDMGFLTQTEVARTAHMVAGAVDIPVIAAGGFFDGRGLAAALAYGAAGIGMGTRFLLTQDSTVPDAVKQKYLAHDLTGTVVTAKVDGMPHRMLRTELVRSLEEKSALKRLGPTMRRTKEFKRMSGLTWRELLADGRSMKHGSDRTWAQMVLAANTPMMLRAGLVEGRTDAGVLASGQVVGVIEDLPTCEELIDRVVGEAAQNLRRLDGLLV